jgi:hypothetical protein
MNDPTYKYIKGKGWIPSTKPELFAPVFRSADDPNWRNVCKRGEHMPFERAYEIMRDEAARWEYYVRNHGWEFKIVSAEEEEELERIRLR